MKQTEEELFTRVWAPTLVSYTNWVINEALSLNIHRLYFLARDARMCYEIACKIVELENLNIEIRYLEGSRYAWRTAEFYLNYVNPINRICVAGVHVTLRKILKRGGLSDIEAEQIASEIGKIEDIDKQLTYAQVMDIRPRLEACEHLKEMIRRASEKPYQNTIEYLKQEGLFEEVPYAIVDSGWVGSLQQTLERLIDREIQGFYFGLYELPKGVDANNYHTYYFRPYKDIEKKVRFSNCLFETICSDQEGMTIGYRYENSRVVPIHKANNPNGNHIAQYQQLLADMISTKAEKDQYILPDKEISKRLEALMSAPSKEVVDTFGSYLFSDDVFDESHQEIAVSLTEKDVKRFHIYGRLLAMKGATKEPFHDSAWPEGSIVKSKDAPGYHLWHVRMYKRLIYIRKRLMKP